MKTFQLTNTIFISFFLVLIIITSFALHYKRVCQPASIGHRSDAELQQKLANTPLVSIHTINGLKRLAVLIEYFAGIIYIFAALTRLFYRHRVSQAFLLLLMGVFLFIYPTILTSYPDLFTVSIKCNNI